MAAYWWRAALTSLKFMIPSANTFTLVTGPQLDGYLFSSATTLADGKVLLVNGYGAHPGAGAVRQTWMWEP